MPRQSYRVAGVIHTQYRTLVCLLLVSPCFPISPWALLLCLSFQERHCNLVDLQHSQPCSLCFLSDPASGAVAEVSSTTISASVSGPDGQTPVCQSLNTATFSARLTAAGLHTLSICLEDQHSHQALQVQPATQLRGVTVVPASVCAHRTALHAMPDRLLAGVTCAFRVCPVDAFGNAGASGTVDILLHALSCCTLSVLVS